MKFFILLVSCLSITIAQCFSQAQPPHIQWERTIGGNKDDELYSLQQTADGGYILGGSSNSPVSGDKTAAPCTTKFDYWIVKTDCEGNIQWQKDIGGGGSDDVVNSVRQTFDGGYIVGGYSQSGAASCQKTSNGYNDDDWWVLKLDNLGNIQWQLDLGGTCNDYLNSVEQTADSGYILGGDSRSNANGNKSVSMCGSNACQVLSDYWVVKLSSTGAIEWQQDYGSTANNGGYPGDENLNAIHQTRDGGYILGGSSNGGTSCTKTTASYANSYDYWVVKIDNVGNLQWQQDIGGNGVDALNDIHQTADGGYIAGGTTTSNTSGNKTSDTWNNSSDYYVVKLDSAGNIQWQKDIGGNKYDGLNSIQQTTDHGYILGGFSNSDSTGDKTSNPLGGYGSGQYDYWVVKLDSAGTLTWQLDIGRNDTQAVLFAVQQTIDGGYMLGGVCNPSSANLSGKVNNVGNPYGEAFGGTGTHFWIVKLGNCNSGFCGEYPPIQDSICLGDSVTLNGIIEYGGFSWEAVPGGSSVSSLSCTACIDPIASPSQTTRYVELSAANPNLYCSDTATVVVIPPQNPITIDTTICTHDAVQLNIPIDSSGFIPHITWSPSYYLNNDTISNPVCTPLSSILYYVTVTNANTCKTVDTVNVTVANLTKSITTDTAICMYDSVQLYAPIEASGIVKDVLWSPDIFLSSDTSRDPFCILSSGMTYVVTIDYTNACKTVDTFNVSVISLTKPDIIDTFICQNTIDPVLHIDADSLMWHTSPNSPGIAIQPTVVTSAPGLDTFYVSNRCGESPVYVQIISAPVLGVSDTTVCQGQSIQLKTPAANDVRYVWDNVDTTCCITVDTSGAYIVTATNICGDTTGSINVLFAACNTCLWAPNAFTPNGDGKNDRFRITDRCGVGTFHIIIVDRFGGVVYDSYNVSDGWDGTFNGKPVDIGTYYYWITATLQVLGSQISLKGDVTVVR